MLPGKPGATVGAWQMTEFDGVREELEALRRERDDLRMQVVMARETLREERDNHRALIDALPLFVFRKDRDGRHIDVSEALCRRLGLSKAEVEGRLDSELSPGALAEKYRRDDLRVMRTGQPISDIEEHNPVDGEPTYVQMQKMPLRNGRGEIIGVQGFLIDVTALKRAQLDLQRRTAELEQALASLKEHQDQLLVAERMASLGRLTAGIAHEMNTPLAAVRSALTEIEALIQEYADSIGDADVGPSDHQAIAKDMSKSAQLAQAAAARAATFVRGIKGHTRDMQARPACDFDAVEAVREALLLVQYMARQSGASLQFSCAHTTVILRGDPGRLAQVVTNLVTNAADACRMQDGGEIDVQLIQAQVGAWQLCVHDTGAGMAKDVQEHIFEPMFTTKPPGQGTGLGLSIVRDIVKADFGGEVQVQSELGKGTTFVVTLPGKKEATDAS